MPEYEEQRSRQVRLMDLDEAVWKLAHDRFEGNINMAIRYLVREGLKNESKAS